MRALDLFSGIGGFALGLERAGFETAAFCELDPFCVEWLRQRWPDVPVFNDVRSLDGRAVGPVDLVCGGFPCQDVSAAGRGEGLAGARSGLWFEMLRIVREVRPVWVLIENVPALRTRGADRVLGDLEESGYTCWPFVVGADNVGFPHRRKRVWIIGRRLADADRRVLRDLEQRIAGGRTGSVCDGWESQPRDDGEGMADAPCEFERAAADEADSIAIGGEARTESGDGSESRELADAQGRGLRADRRAPGKARYPDFGDAGLVDPPRDGGTQGSARIGTVATGPSDGGTVGLGTLGAEGGFMADRDRGRCEGEWIEDDDQFESAPWDFLDGCSRAWLEHRRRSEAAAVGQSDLAGLERHSGAGPDRREARDEPAAPTGLRWPAGPGQQQHAWEAGRTITDLECELGVSVDGLPRGLGATLNRARLKAAGNSVVPQIVELIGRVIMNIEGELRCRAN